MSETSKVRAICFHLPQYHPIRENDEWWGKGFTDWTNVARTRPRFKDHYQPHLPADLGFYDLRLPEAREAQAELARQHGIHGFCYYHYWFNGRRLLERPFNEILASGQPSFPFCLCWANENWTRRWDGQERDVLLEQNYSDEDDLNHIRWLANAFRDPRYIRVEGKPIFLVYRLSRLPNPARSVEIWRNEASALGVGDIFICNVESMPSEHGLAPLCKLDGTVEFAPDWDALPPQLRGNWLTRKLSRSPKLLRTAGKLGLTEPWLVEDRVFSYAEFVQKMTAKPDPSYLRFPGAMPSWDNSSRRRSGAFIFKGSTPELYEKLLRAAVRKARSAHPQDPVVFINAWNEWAEGNHLEPCQRWGDGYLRATLRALKGEGSNEVSPPHPVAISESHL
jgi:lipopolysaccharide biosynthesis protein